ncbi:MAG: hypothetical protein EA351_10845 [Gemmatimonadales bacterium]|nr:MAG: hypothetical protein EA351_10845 [Gemmatimonadales bacterium]
MSARRRSNATGAPPPTLREQLDALPAWVAPLVFTLTTVILFREFIFSRDMLFGSDTLALGYTARLFFAEALQTTGFPAWNPYILGGTPFLESLVGGDALHPLSVALFYLTEPYRALGWKLVLHVGLSGFFMFGWLRILGVSRGAAMLGGLGFLLSPWMVSLVFPGHDGKIFVTAMTPLLFWLAEWMWHRRDLLPPALLALAIATVIFSTHFQMAYFLFGGLGAYMIFRAIQVGRREGPGPAGRHFATFLLFSILGAGAAGIQLIPAVDYVTEHSRRAATTVGAETPEAARAFSASWSLHPEEALALAVPEFVGANTRSEGWAAESYWGRNAFKLNHEYLGAGVLLLALLAFLGPLRGGAPPGIRWFLLGMGGVAFLFALGANTPVWRLFYEIVPGISLFRAPSMAIFLTGFGALTLMALGVDRGADLLDGLDEAKAPVGKKGGGRTGSSGGPPASSLRPGALRVVRTLGVGTALFLLGGVLAASGILFQLWTAVVYPGISDQAIATLEASRGFIVIGFFVTAVIGGALTLVWWAAARGLIGGVVLALILTLVVGADLFRVNVPFIQTLDPARVTVPDPNLRFLQDRVREEPPFRVFSMIQGGQDVEPANFGIELAGGHHPNDLLRYNQLIGMRGGGVPENLASFNENALYILNVRYLLWPGSIEGVEPVSQVQLQDGRIWASVYPYPGGPRARVVGSYRQVGEGEALSVVLDEEGFDPRRETVLERRPAVEPGGEGVGGRVEWIERTPDRLHFRVEATGPALVVVAENWFPAWTARVDGEQTEVLRADHTLRAISVPQGRSEVVMTYESSQLRVALRLSLASLLLVTGAGLFAGVRSRRERVGAEGSAASREVGAADGNEDAR